MAVVVGRMLAILEAQTAQFEARMSAASQHVARWTSTTGSAARGTAMLRTGLQQLAFEGLGVMPPALARVSTGMLTIFGPAGVMLGAVAVLGVVSMAFDRAAKSAQELVETGERVRNFQMGHTKMLGDIGPGIQQTPAEQLLTLEEQRRRALDFQKRLGPAMMGLARVAVGEDPTQVAAAATRNYDAITEAIHRLDRAIRDLKNDLLPMPRSFLDQINERLTIELPSRLVVPSMVGGGGLPDIDRSPGAHFLGSTDFAPREFFLQELEKAGGKTRPSSWMTPEFLMMSTMALAQGAQNGPGGFLTAMSGPLAMANPAIGAVSATLGTIFGIFDRNEERRQRDALDELKRIRENTERRGQPGRVSVTILLNGREVSGAILEDVLYGIRRAERTNAVPILPPS